VGMSAPSAKSSSKDLGTGKRKKKRVSASRKDVSGVSGDANGQATPPTEARSQDLELEELIQSLTFEPVGKPRSKAKLSADQEAALDSEAPELAGVLRNFSSRVTELCKGSIAEASKQVASPDFAIDGGMPLMQVKIQLLMSYLTNLSYYILLKTQGVSVSDHPVIPQLIWLRTLLEKIRPIEQRLQYQMNKLLELSEKPVALADPKNLRPGELVASVEAEPGEDDEADAELEKAQDDVYRPPKVTEVEYTGDHVSAIDRAEKNLEKARKRLENSEMMRSMREEFTDAPTEVQGKIQSKEQARIRRKMEEKLQYEEENMTRLRLSKRERKDVQRVMREKYGSTTSSLDDAFDFTSLANEMEGNRGKLGKKGGSARRGLGSAIQGYKSSTENVKSLKRAAIEAREADREDGHQAIKRNKKKRTV